MGEQVPLMHRPLLRHLKLETAQPDHPDGDEELMITKVRICRFNDD